LKNAKNAFENMQEFMLESDYIDDLKRPGAVIGPKTLPRTVRRLSNVDEERMFRVMKDLPEQIYGISMD
jgi:Predicted metal-dependent hydrolase (urease superfamily)